MRLIVECEHEAAGDRCDLGWCLSDRTITDPDAILAALVEAGLIDAEPTVEYPDGRHGAPDGADWFWVPHTRYVSPWKPVE